MHPIIRESGKLFVNAIQDSCVALGKAAGIVDFPVPPNSSMRKTSSRSIRHYYVSGAACCLPIATMALHCGVRLREPVQVLDFGCGVGRQLLHFTRNFPRARFLACDVDYTLIDFVRRNYPSVNAVVNRFDPPLPYDADSIDMIYSVSIFSHLNPAHQRLWLAELYRVLKPGGVCFLTTEGRIALRQMGGMFDADVLEGKGILYKAYDFLGQRSITPVTNVLLGIEGSYGSTVMTPEYIRSQWPSCGFEVREVIEGIIDMRQDLVVLQKPAVG
jgi:SAM-dependent methyltransferase